MARLIPSEIEASTIGGRHNSEARTLVRLRDELSDQFTVYHGVHWTKSAGAGSAYGEIDFIISNRFGYLLAIEQKDAQVSVTDIDLVVHYPADRNKQSPETARSGKSVTTQVNRNLNALRSQFTKRYPGRSLQIDYLLYLPMARVESTLPASVDPSRVIDADSDHLLISTIETLLDLQPNTSTSEYLDDLPRIDVFLSERVAAAPHIGLLGRSAREHTTRLSGGLATWVWRLNMDPWRLRVKGTAGSGKTQLALSVLQEASTAGKNSIYVCFNRPLADAMKRIVPDPSAVVTFHELARLTSALAGYPLPDFGEKDVFEQLERRFLELAGRLSETFDAVIIDEGQDMHASWASSLIGMAKPNAPLLWLEDTDQSLYDRDAVDLPGWVTISSPVNYRSPKLLVEFINWLGLTDTPIETGGALLGFDPAWYVYADSASAQATTDQAVRSLLSEGFSPENIAVLSFRGIAQSQIAGKSGPDKIAGVAVRRQQGYDDQGSAIWTEGQILVDTVYRFKGQAADAVVITEIDFSDWSDKDRRKLFVALTRARLQAVLVTSERAAHIIQNRLEG